MYTIAIATHLTVATGTQCMTHASLIPRPSAIISMGGKGLGTRLHSCMHAACTGLGWLVQPCNEVV